MSKDTLIVQEVDKVIAHTLSQLESEGYLSTRHEKGAAVVHSISRDGIELGNLAVFRKESAPGVWIGMCCHAAERGRKATASDDPQDWADEERALRDEFLNLLEHIRNAMESDYGARLHGEMLSAQHLEWLILTEGYTEHLEPAPLPPVTVHLERKPEVVADSLERLTEHVSRRQFSADGSGYYVLEPARVIRDKLGRRRHDKEDKPKCLKLKMDGRFCIEPTGASVRCETLSPMIWFEIRELDDKEAKLLAQCWYPPVNPYLEELLQAVEEDLDKAAKRPVTETLAPLEGRLGRRRGPMLDTLDSDQRRQLENVRAAAGRIWSRPLHRYYTDHTMAHSERVIALLDGLTAGVMRTDKWLSPTEVFVLLAAAYLHDIGMQNERFANGDPSTSSGQRLEEIRAHHHEQTAEMIYKVFEDPANAFAIPLSSDPGVVEAVALVAKGHRRVDLHDTAYDPFVHGGETVRLRLLAALLRFADALDMDHRRVDLKLMKLLDLPPESQLHWWRCHYVSGVSIEDEYVRIAYRFPQEQPDYEEFIVPLVETDVRREMTNLEEIFRANAVKVALGKPQVRPMRAVQPLPPGVEALAREQVGATAADRVPHPPA